MKEDQIMGQGNYTLASHHVFAMVGASQMLFSPLENAKNGMSIYLTDKDNIYTYVITSVEIVAPDSIYVLADHEGISEVTLVTCTDAEATQRTIVKGVLESQVSFDDADQTAKKPLNKVITKFLGKSFELLLVKGAFYLIYSFQEVKFS